MAVEGEGGARYLMIIAKEEEGKRRKDWMEEEPEVVKRPKGEEGKRKHHTIPAHPNRPRVLSPSPQNDA